MATSTATKTRGDIDDLRKTKTGLEKRLRDTCKLLKIELSHSNNSSVSGEVRETQHGQREMQQIKVFYSYPSAVPVNGIRKYAIFTTDMFKQTL